MAGVKTQFWVLLVFLIIIAARAAEPESGKRQNVTIEIQIQDRHVVGEKNTFRVYQGMQVKLVVTIDEAASLHLHGYDIEFEVTPGEPATVSLTAHATGRFPVTSHGWGGDHDHGHQTLFYLEVYPQ